VGLGQQLVSRFAHDGAENLGSGLVAADFTCFGAAHNPAFLRTTATGSQYKPTADPSDRMKQKTTSIQAFHMGNPFPFCLSIAFCLVCERLKEQSLLFQYNGQNHDRSSVKNVVQDE